MDKNQEALAILEVEIRRLAEAYPTAHYPNGRCRYTLGEVKESGNCGCLVGQALKNCLNNPVLKKLFTIAESFDKNDTSASFRTLYYAFNPGWLEDETAEVCQSVIWIEHVQSWQDNNCPWGECVASADSGESE